MVSMWTSHYARKRRRPPIRSFFVMRTWPLVFVTLPSGQNACARSDSLPRSR